MTAAVPDVAETELRPLGRWSLAWRVLGSVVLVLLLLNGSLRMADDAWPFGPMSQYAFFPGPDDTVDVTRVYGLLADGRRVELPLRVETAGISRAEIEDHRGDIERDPGLLRTVRDGWAARHPTEPRLTELFLVSDRTFLHEGRETGADQVTLATWVVAGG